MDVSIIDKQKSVINKVKEFNNKERQIYGRTCKYNRTGTCETKND